MNKNKRQNNNQLIIFRTDPAKITALLAYMAATIHLPKWDLCIAWIIKLRAGMHCGGFANRPWLITS